MASNEMTSIMKNKKNRNPNSTSNGIREMLHAVYPYQKMKITLHKGSKKCIHSMNNKFKHYKMTTLTEKNLSKEKLEGKMKR